MNLDEIDFQVKSRCVKQRELFNIADAASLLFRLELEGKGLNHNYLASWVVKNCSDSQKFTYF